jgi:hypothetical protein
LNSDLIQEVVMASSDTHRDSADNGPDTTPGIPPSRPVPLVPHPVPDTAFHPPQRDGMSGLTIGLAAAVVVLGLYVLINWPWSRKPVTVAPEVAAVAPSAAPAEPALAGPSVPAVTPAPAPAAAAASGVHRCEKAGQVSYTDGPCPAGMRGSAVNVSEALSVEGARGATLYRCKGAGQFWSIVHCQHRGAEIVSMHTVPADLPLAEQIVFARNRQALSRPAATVAARGAVALGPPAPLDAAGNKARHCKHLDELIAALDDYARQPLQAYEQDAIRRDRKKARDEQFGLRCGR